MKVLTLHQPWASLIALGVKTIETRSWSTQYRGPLAIHAAARTPAGREYDPGRRPRVGEFALQRLREPWGVDWAIERPTGERGVCIRTLLPLGAIVATCTLVDVVPIIGNGTDDHRDAGFTSYVLAVAGRAAGLRLCDWANTGWGEANEDAGRYGGRFVEIEDQRPYGDFTPGRFAWLLADITPVDPPVPFKGGQGLTKTWEPEAVLA